MKEPTYMRHRIVIIELEDVKLYQRVDEFGQYVWYDSSMELYTLL